jgi:hypothetical protein
LVENLTGVNWHNLSLCGAASRAGNDRLLDHATSTRVPDTHFGPHNSIASHSSDKAGVAGHGAPPALLSYLAERNIATFSTDLDCFDFKLHRPEQLIQSVMNKLKKNGKGMVLMHDFQRQTAEAMPLLWPEEARSVYHGDPNRCIEAETDHQNYYSIQHTALP